MATVTNESQQKRQRKGRKRSSSTEEAVDGDSGGMVPLRKGPWTAAEDEILKDYVRTYGEGNWNAVQKHTGLRRCGKSCRLRWTNHLRPNLKKGVITPAEERLIVELHAKHGNKWARMAAELPGRTDNEIKNFWNTRAKRHQRSGRPVYPPDMSFQVLDESQDSQSRITSQSGEKQRQDFFQADSLYIPETELTDFEVREQEYFHHYPLSRMQIPSMASLDTCGFDFPPLPIREQDQLLQIPILGLNGSITNTSALPLRGQQRVSSEIPFPGLDGCKASPLQSLSNNICEPSGIYDLVNMNPKAGGELPTILSNLILSDRISSASKPIDGMMKLELPSLQCLEARDPLITPTPQVPPLESSCVSSQSSGLWEAVLHEAPTVSSSQSQMPSDEVENLLSNPNETEQEVPGNPSASLGHGISSAERSMQDVIRFDASPETGDLSSETLLFLDWLGNSEIQSDDVIPLSDDAITELLGEGIFAVNEDSTLQSNHPKDPQVPLDSASGSDNP